MGIRSSHQNSTLLFICKYESQMQLAPTTHGLGMRVDTSSWPKAQSNQKKKKEEKTSIPSFHWTGLWLARGSIHSYLYLLGLMSCQGPMLEQPIEVNKDEGLLLASHLCSLTSLPHSIDDHCVCMNLWWWVDGV